MLYWRNRQAMKENNNMTIKIKRKNVVAFAVLVLLFVLPFAFYQVDAAQYRALGLIIDTACKKSSNSLDIKDIISLDTSNKIYTGSFFEQDGDLIRKCT